MRRTLTRSVAKSSSSGTLPYMAPEKFSKKHQTIKASDIFSLGVSLYELLTGDLPFGEHGGLILNTGAEVPDLPENFSPELNTIVSACMAKEPWDRPTALQLKQCGKNFLKTGVWEVPVIHSQPAPAEDITRDATVVAQNMALETESLPAGRKTEKITFQPEEISPPVQSEIVTPPESKPKKKKRNSSLAFLGVVILVVAVLIILIKTNVISFHHVNTVALMDSNLVKGVNNDSIRKARQDSINLAMKNKVIQDSIRQKQIRDSIQMAEDNQKNETPVNENIVPDKTTGKFTDSRDGHTYKTVTYGGTMWMAENLNYDSYDSWCFDEEPSNCRRYGRLYTWVSATSACPKGWHLPGDNEWAKLEKALEKNIQTGTTGWRGSSAGSKLLSGGGAGFNAELAGFGDSYNNFDDKNMTTSFWTSTQYNSQESWKRGLKVSKSSIYRGPSSKENRFSVRCVKN